MPSHFYLESMHIGLIWGIKITPITNTNICMKYSYSMHFCLRWKKKLEIISYQKESGMPYFVSVEGNMPILNEEPRMVPGGYSIKCMVENSFHDVRNWAGKGQTSHKF
jgi:hypothetical protein